MKIVILAVPYFVLHNLDVQKPTPVPKEERRKNRVSSKQRKRKRQRQNNVYEEKVYEVHSRKPNRNSGKRNKIEGKDRGQKLAQSPFYDQTERLRIKRLI